MTGLQVYFLLVPFVLLAIGGLAYWWSGTWDLPHRRHPGE
jgi:hypothetical protein